MISQKFSLFWKKYSFLVFIVIANAWFLPSIYLQIVKYLRAPPDTIFPFIHTDFFYDYNVYLSAITQGISGSWLFKNPFTVEPQPSSVYYILYIAIGKMAALMHLWAPLAYHVAKFFIVEFFITASYFISVYLLGQSVGFWATLLGLGATLSPLTLFRDPQAYVTYTPWWNLVESFTRLDGIPHYIAAQASALVAILFVFFFHEKRRWSFLVPASIFAVASAIMFPPSVFPLLFGFPLSCGILLLRSCILHRYKRDVHWPFILGLALVCVAIAAAIGFEWLQSVNDPIWIQYKIWEVNQWNSDPHFVLRLLLSFGILPALSVGGLLWALTKGKWIHLFIAVWAVLPFLLLPVINLFGMGKIRVTNEAPFVPLGILAALSLFNLKPSGRTAAALWTCGGVVMFLILTVPTTIQLYSIHLASARNSPLWDNEYIRTGVFDAIDYTNREIPKNSAFLSDVWLGNIIPAYSHARSFVGHQGQTLDFPTKSGLAEQFVNGRMDERDALDLIQTYGISYVYVDSLNNRKEIAKYSFLISVYQNPEITIYRVKR